MSSFGRDKGPAWKGPSHLRQVHAPHICEAAGNPSAEPEGGLLPEQRLPEHLPRLFFHRPAMTRGPHPETLLQRVVKVPDCQTGHRFTPCTDSNDGIIINAINESAN